MKTLKSTLFACLFLFPALLLSEKDNFLPDPQLVIKKCLEAHGSERAIENIYSMRLSGLLSQGSQSAKIVIIKKRPNQTRLKINYSPQSFYIKAYNGKELWEKESDVPARLLPQNVSDSFIHDTGLFCHLLHTKENEATVSLLGKAKIGNFSCFQLLLRLPNSTEITYFIDDQEFLERKSTLIENNQLTSLFFSDFKTINGVKVPCKILKCQDKTPDVVLDIHKVDFNLGISPHLFDIPDSTS